MASQMVVPASKDTLFMRGFSARQNIEALRDFFIENGGPCTVEFFKESEDQNKLYVALRFDTKDVAKEVLNRYDNKEVLGDRITISWFKDLRRARAKGKHEMHGRRPFGNSNWQDRSPDNYYHGGRQGQYGRGGRGYGGRDYSSGGRRDRDRDRDRNDRSSSRSRSRSRSYSRERSPSGSPRRGRQRRSRSRSGESPRNYRRSSSSPIKDQGKEVTPQRANVSGRSASRHDDPTPDAKREYGDDQSLDRASLSQRSHSPVPMKNKSLRSAVSSVPRSDMRGDDDGAEGERYPPRSEERRRDQFKDESFGDERRPAPEEEPPRKIKSGRHGDDYQFFEAPYENKGFANNSFSPERKEKVRGRSDDRGGMADFPASPPQVKEDFGFKSERPETFPYRPEERRGPPPREGRDWVQPPRSPQNMEDMPPRRKRSYEDGFEQEFDGDMKRSKRFHDDIEPARDNRRGGPDERSRMEKGARPPARDRSPVDDRQSVSSSQRGGTMSSFNGNMNKEVERGALGLPQDKMIMVREKKEEIEKSYRQDCETFAAVTKMLISKDQELEDKLQHSLRDNLKDIGQRCIHELREFIDKLKTEEGM